MKNLYLVLPVLIVSILLSAYSYGATMTLQSDAVGRDTYVNSVHPSTNYGPESDLYIRQNLGIEKNYLLIAFDLSSLPANQVITSAVLELYDFYIYTASSMANAYKVTSSWNEYSVTWISQPTIDISTPITNSGGTPSVNNWVEWDITDFVEDWYTAPSTNHGVELRNILSNTQHVFRSSDSPQGNRPKLTITYEEAVPEPEPVPEPATMLLLGVSGLGLLLKRKRK